MVSGKTLFTGDQWDDVYRLPPNAFKIWIFHYRCEINGRESWPGEDTICNMLEICRDTLADNRKWLKKHGWLVQTGKAYRGRNPTFRVERGWIPNASESTEESRSRSSRSKRYGWESIGKKQMLSNASEKMRRKNTDAYVYGSDSGSSVLGSSLLPSSSDSVRPPAGAAGTAKNNEEKQNPKPPTQIETSGKTKSHLAPDGTSWREWDAHDQAWHTAKLIELGLTKPGVGASVPKQKPNAKARAATIYETPYTEFQYSVRCTSLECMDRNCTGCED
jgi:hypothetical protein